MLASDGNGDASMSKLEIVDIRRIGAERVADYRAIRLTALQLDPDAFGSTYEVEAARPLTWFEDATRNLAIFGAYADERIVGMIGFGRHAGAKIQHKGFLWGMFVHPSLRRHGVGAALLHAAIDHASPVVEQITLSVVTTNRSAIALYEKFGFTTYGREIRALKVDGNYADELLMVRFC